MQNRPQDINPRFWPTTASNASNARNLHVIASFKVYLMHSGPFLPITCAFTHRRVPPRHGWCARGTDSHTELLHFYTREGERYYYTEAMGRNKDYVHVHCHYYMTTRLAYMFRVLQMLGHVSHFNLVNWFNMIFVDDSPPPTFTPNQLFTPSMSEEECRHGLVLHSLIKHADRRGNQLVVSSSGTDNLRFEAAIESHLDQLLIEGSKYRDHFCSSCVCVLPDSADPVTGEEHWKIIWYRLTWLPHPAIRAVVTDGVTLGHWRCSAATDQLRELTQSSAAWESLPGTAMPKGLRIWSRNLR
ncbi:uncharacterized protein MELLADRAFT_86071 [Melampsora larici-populina 98AG31]|uniref:CxC5 like cysteine cluster associated with KDZ domain-containing protein n=1 Tax=Melampsora larici-populina (strain 98AG31 / pathotype 3-4-7) TaxID=747676 RepID=F4RKN9_MELLP|nr:uncharacterized protein MELLADRAFT_86071 [Melampsora larici-populina 98AG31]EGG07144.1 hypothetical protein MELLADRAFT_86071 [Melampsora larici-populina 98AG31]